MKIELVEVIERIFTCNDIDGIKFWTPAIVELLRAEAWHPIEKAAELGAHTGEIAVLGYGDWGGQNEWFPMIWEGKFWTSSGDFVNPTHFRFINPPEN